MGVHYDSGMTCPRCQHANPQGARFCEECATPLARTCSNCGTPLSVTAKFCHACAHPVAAATGTESRFASPEAYTDRKSTRLNSSHVRISYAVFCLYLTNCRG